MMIGNEFNTQPRHAWEQNNETTDPDVEASTKDFFSRTTFHGVRYIYQKSPFRFRRWVIYYYL